MSSRLTLEALEVLDAIDRKGSFAAAAAALYKVPSAVTYSIQKLEEDLGVRLFVKEGRRSVLTPAGRALLEQGRELLSAADRLVEHTRQVDSGWESCLNIAVDSLYGVEGLYPLLHGLTELRPQMELNLYEEVLGGTWEAISQGRVDIAVGATTAPANTQGFRTEPLMDVEWEFMVAPFHPLASRQQPLTSEDLKHHRAIVVRDSSTQLPPLTRNLLEQQPVMTVATLQQKIRAQVQGLGCGYLPSMSVQSELASGQLVSLGIEGAPVSSPLNLVWKANNKGQALKWFVEQLLAQHAL
jgi:DNA-binding transcriptional LysR family regulator